MKTETGRTVPKGFVSQSTQEKIAELEKTNTFESQEIFWTMQGDCGIMLVNNRKQVYMVYQILSTSQRDDAGLTSDK